MKIKKAEISVREIFEGYKDSGDFGVVGYNGLLNIRPEFQREFVYNESQRAEVLNTVSKGFPLNIIYWTVKNDKYELLDGQQRTLSICQYVDNAYSLKIFDSDYNRNFANLKPEEKNKILDYKLDVYICEGTDREKIDWFNVINIAGEKLTEQERRNAVFTGPWLALAKAYFSKNNCPAYAQFKDYLSGSSIRQEYLETALSWISDRDTCGIDDYMANHQNDNNIDDIQLYFESVFAWVKTVFKTYYKEMKGIKWGILYNKYHNNTYNSTDIDKKVSDLMADSDVTKKSGIFEYILSGNEKYLSIRAFDANTKRTVYKKQNGRCVKCGKNFDIKDMEGDHIIPWSKGGQTVIENCQMICIDCNRRKSDK